MANSKESSEAVGAVKNCTSETLKIATNSKEKPPLSG